MKLLSLGLLIIHSFGPLSIDDNGIKYMSNLAKRTAKRELGISLTVSVEKYPEAQQNMPLETWPFPLYVKEYMKWESMFSMGKGITYIALPPLISDDGKQWLMGISKLACRPKGGVAMGNAENTNQDGLGRVYNSAIVLMHEALGHSLNAPHDDRGPNIMHPTANNFVTERPLLRRLHFTQKSKNQIRRCLQYGY